MDIDKIEGFAALEHYGIRVARSKYVDSAEDAVAFAERRNAPDPRFVPIVLHQPASAPAERPEAALETVDGIRRAYEHLRRHSGNPILAQEYVAPGTDIAISGKTGDGGIRTIEVRSAAHAVQRMCPLGPDGAEALASNYEGYGHHGKRESARRMLEHLALKVSEFFEHSGVHEFRLDVRLHENAYTVFDASMTSLAPLHVKKRLDARAHDRKGDEYHSAGRQ
jgi:hypothetical protein